MNWKDKVLGTDAAKGAKKAAQVLIKKVEGGYSLSAANVCSSSSENPPSTAKGNDE